jgi:hypothetical protein
MKFDFCIPRVVRPPTASFKGVELFDHILRRGGVFELQRGKKIGRGEKITLPAVGTFRKRINSSHLETVQSLFRKRIRL